jgi:hypothetical protein
LESRGWICGTQRTTLAPSWSDRAYVLSTRYSETGMNAKQVSGAFHRIVFVRKYRARISWARNQRQSVRRAEAPAFKLVSCVVYCATLNIESICSTEKSVDFQRNTRRYIPKNSNVHNHLVETSNPTKCNEIWQMQPRYFGLWSNRFSPHWLVLVAWPSWDKFVGRTYGEGRVLGYVLLASCRNRAERRSPGALVPRRESRWT